jgi:polynucleotide 5'-hydroxyl-kinase GRC3/NOL9
MPKVTVPEGYTLIVEGEACFRVLSGEVRVFGSAIEGGKEYLVEPFRAVPLYASKETEVEVLSGKFSFAKGDTVPSSWEEAFEELKRGVRRVMVVGGVDSGKTSLATFLANRFAEGGERVAVIDADIGQKSIGPPASVGLGLVERPVISLSEAEFVDGFFVGNITPAGLLHRHLAGVKLLLDKAEGELGASRVVIDTTGWVTEWEGRELKVFKALVVKPDAVLVVSKPGECVQMVKLLGQVSRVIRVDSPQLVRPRDRLDRKEYRKYLYRKFLRNAKTQRVSFAGGRFLYTTTFSGMELDRNEASRLEYIIGSRVFFAEKSDDHLSIIAEKAVPEEVLSFLKTIYGHRRVRVFTGAEFMHSLVGISGGGKLLKGIGVIVSLDFSSRSFEVLSGAEVTGDDTVMLGFVKVNPASLEEETIIEKASIF